MGALELLVIFLAGVGAGTINTVVGSGTLITFPTLLVFGVDPVVANVSNNIGLAPGSVSGAVGYRRELTGQRARVLRLSSASLVGGAAGAVLLLVLPEEAFETIVPVLIMLGVVLVAAQPRISRAVAARRGDEGPRPDPWWTWPAALLAGVYGGYFGAAQGVILMGILGIGVHEALQRLNAVKNVLAAVVNGVAGVIFAVVADVDWSLVLVIAVGAVIGGQVGASVGRSLPAPVLRAVIIVVGLVAFTSFVV